MDSVFLCECFIHYYLFMMRKYSPAPDKIDNIMLIAKDFCDNPHRSKSKSVSSCKDSSSLSFKQRRFICWIKICAKSQQIRHSLFSLADHFIISTLVWGIFFWAEIFYRYAALPDLFSHSRFSCHALAGNITYLAVIRHFFDPAFGKLFYPSAWSHTTKRCQ